MGATVKIDLSGARKKLSARSLQNGRREFANVAHRTMNENYVPMRFQSLRDQSFVESDGEKITWTSRYAGAQYAGKRTTKNGKVVYFSNYTTPGTGPKWDELAKPVFMSSWLQAFKRGADW